MNDAFLLKLIWRIYTEPQALWVQILTSNNKGNEFNLGRISIPQPNNEEDVLSWKHSADGIFIVASAYKHLTQENRKTTENWKEIWRSPERTKVFLWQVAHDRIFTAKRRVRLMGTPPYCHICPNQEESTLHALRDCPCVALVWNKLVQPSILATFFTANFKSGLNLNLTNAIVHGSSTAWTDIFMTICWQVSCGGLIRTNEGEWIGGFRANLDYCQATQAELWGVHYGLQIAWSLRMRRVIVKLDSLNAIMYIKRNSSDSHGHSHIIRKIAELMKQPWKIIFRHVYREANRCVD
ncbi:hypothetical protein AHAS_Ahas20G0031700 [Arachis hypogaea]